jgi:hypothetical protein
MGLLQISPLHLARRAVRDRTALAVACLAGILGLVLRLPLPTTGFLVLAGWSAEFLLRSVLEGSISFERRAPVNPAGPEAGWLLRSEQAVRAINRLAQSAPKGPVADRCRSIAANAALSIAEIRRIAGRASQIGAMLVRIDPDRLALEESRLTADLAAAGTALLTGELKRSIESVRAQQAVHERLSAAAGAALARVQSASMGLDGLVARMAEIVALADEGGPSAMAADHLGELALEMEALRAGLADSTTNLEVT